MTTSTRLWLGFGILTALLLVSGLASLARLGSMERGLQQLSDVARARCAASRELAIGASSYALAVSSFAHTGDSGFVEEADQEAAELASELTSYEALADTPPRRALAARFAILWGALQDAGDALLESSLDAAHGAEVARLAYLRSALGEFLDEEIEADASAQYAADSRALMADLDATGSFLLGLLLATLGVAVVTSVAVGRGIVRSEHERGHLAATLDAFLSSAPVGLALVDRNLGYQRVNQTFANAGDRVQDPAAKAAPVASLEEVLKPLLRRVIERSELLSGRELKLWGPVGAGFWSLTLFPVHMRRQGVIGAGVVMTNVTDQRLAEEALRTSEESYRTLAEVLPSALYTCDAEGRITFFNESAAALWGRRPQPGEEDQRFCGSYRLWWPDGRPLVHDDTPMAQALREGRSFRGEEIVIEQPDGRRVNVMVNIDPLRDHQGQITGAVNAFVDITRMRAAEVRLRQSEASFRTLADAIPQLVWTAEPDGTVDYYNERVRQLKGFRWNSETGRWSWKECLHPDDLGATAGAWELAVATGSEYHIEHRVRVVEPATGEDTYRWFLSRALPARDDAGRIVKWFGAATDIQANKDAEQALEQANRRKTEFLATLAHELRNPLAPMVNALEILRIAAAGDAAFGEARTIIERQLRFLVRLVDDLLDLSRLDHGKLVLRRRTVTVAEVIDQAVETTRHEVQEAGQSLSVELPSQPLFLNGDPVRLVQIFLNLINNASRYTGNGGRIRVRVEREGPWVVVRVSDTGIGMAPEDLDALFSMFHQASGTGAQPGRGLGIGLALTRSLVEMHGGRVEARSDGLGRGSEFIVRLPLLAEEPAPQPASPPVRPQPGGRRRILVADDHRDGADSLAVLLRLNGHEVETAFDGLQAVEAAERARPEVILLDIGMPGLDGYEACRRIREQPWGQRPRIIALTGWGQDEDRRRTAEAGFDDHLVKPVEPARLLTLLSQASEKAAL